MNAVFRYPGAKWSIADWIIAHFPSEYEKLCYLEPFAGSAAVFFNKNPSRVETINDLDSNIVNLFRVLRDRPEELRRAIELTPYSREEYEQAVESFDHPDPLEKARRFYDFITLQMRYNFMPSYFILEDIAQSCARSTIVSGPGQKASASVYAAGGTSAQ